MTRDSDLPRLTRREWLKLSTAGVLGASASGWIENLAHAAAGHPARKRACILLWMNGGASQMDTFDMKPGTDNGGPFRPIQTKVSGLDVCEYLPRVGKHADKLGVLRSMKTTQPDHPDGVFRGVEPVDRLGPDIRHRHPEADRLVWQRGRPDSLDREP